MLHYFIWFALLPSIVTPALAYPLVSNNTLQEGLVRRMNTQPPSEGYQEVHPCRPTFSLHRTKLYTSVFTDLKDCTARRDDHGNIGIAFWPLDPVGCGLVWPSMTLIGDEGAKHGTCFVGPKNAKAPWKGLSPCQHGFVNSMSSFYDRLPLQPRNRPQVRISLAECMKQKEAVAWRAAPVMKSTPICITLPLNGEHPNGLGYCYGYETERYKLWYIRHTIRPGERPTYYALQGRDKDWVEIPPGLLQPE